MAAYFSEPGDKRTQAVLRFGKKFDHPWHIPEAVLIECENVFANLARETNSQPWRKLEADLGSRVILIEQDWKANIGRARELFRRFSPQARIGTFDAVILASALRAGATHFLSFDTNSNLRALAAVLRLNVFPELTVEDRRRITLFR